MLAVLVSVRADLNPADHDGKTPMMIAMERGHTPTVKMLITAGAGISAASAPVNTLFLSAIAVGDLEFVKVLIAAGASVLSATTLRADGAGLISLAQQAEVMENGICFDECNRTARRAGRRRRRQ